MQKMKTYRKIGPYILRNQIGKGSYSTVYEAVSEGQVFAIKQISIQDKKQKMIQRMHQELNVLLTIKHQNIVQLLDYRQTSHHLYLIFQRCLSTNLQSYIETQHEGKLSVLQTRNIIVQLLQAFIALRQHRIVHRDLKLANILVTKDFKIKLADFGFAKTLGQQEFLKSIVGTRLTMAPEVQNRHYNQKCDIWSIGVITYQMIFGQSPFFSKAYLQQKKNLTESQFKACLKKQIVFPWQIDSQAEHFIRSCLIYIPENRISFEELFNHKWVNRDLQFKNNSFFNKQTLKKHIEQSLSKCNNRTEQQKRFILQNSQGILGYCLYEWLKSYMQNNMKTWINIAKNMIQQPHMNGKLTFLALAILLDNINRTLSQKYKIILNSQKVVIIDNYLTFRKIQTWKMTEFSQFMPKLIQKGKSSIQSYLEKQIKIQFKQKQIPLWTLFINQLKCQIQNQKSNLLSLKQFFRLKPNRQKQLSINVASPLLQHQAIKLLIKNISFKFEYNELYKKYSNLFKLNYQTQISSDQMYLSQLFQKIT